MVPVPNMEPEPGTWNLEPVMFESLSNRLQDVFKSLRGETRLTPENYATGPYWEDD